MASPLISIITVTRNAADTLERTLISVDGQTFLDYEHLVIDGASTDATASVAAARPSIKRRFDCRPAKGLYDAMNRGLSEARGTYVVFLNAGDAFHDRDVLARVASAIADAGSPGIVYGQTDIVDDDGRYLHPRHFEAPENLALSDFRRGMVVCHQAFFVLRRITVPFDLRYRYSADYDWCIHCLQHSRHNVYVDRPALVDYLSEGLTTRNRRASLRERFRIMARHYGFFHTILLHLKLLFGVAS